MDYVSAGMKSAKSAASPGRPRAFCVDQALDQALKVFWRKGYEGTSLSDLTAAMGINRPSLYAAYGNKEALFRKALDRYMEGAAEILRESMEKPTARGAVEHLLLSSADGATCPDNPHGCLTVRCALSSSEAADCIRLEMIRRRVDGESILCRRLEQAQAEGDLPADVVPADLARYVMTVHQGMSVQAAGGASGEQLRQVVGMALKAWPC